jgi:hypothetical protein
MATKNRAVVPIHLNSTLLQSFLATLVLSSSSFAYAASSTLSSLASDAPESLRQSMDIKTLRPPDGGEIHG